jgi:hypothetical protein
MTRRRIGKQKRTTLRGQHDNRDPDFPSFPETIIVQGIRRFKIVWLADCIWDALKRSPCSAVNYLRTRKWFETWRRTTMTMKWTFWLATKGQSMIQCADFHYMLGPAITHDTIKNAKVMNISNINAVWDVKYIKWIWPSDAREREIGRPCQADQLTKIWQGLAKICSPWISKKTKTFLFGI